ncbi:MAG: aminotransferase class IV [Nitriliruptorales bacterium]|nr:aminotransferase class IV [Nitriliruptorales bacterium]
MRHETGSAGRQVSRGAAIAWADGRVLPAAQATVPLLDDGFLRGDAVFDSVLVRRGRTHALDRHLARLRASAKAVGIRVPVVTRVVGDLLAAWGDRDGALKLIVTRSGALRGLIQVVEHPASLALHPVELPWRTALSGVKTLSYAANQHALRIARAAHADDALIVDGGLVQELPTAAICVVRNGAVASPDPGRQPILDSVTVRELDDLAGVERTRLTVDDVYAADEVFVVSATRPVIPVHAVADREFPSPGEATARLQEEFDAHIEDNLDDPP